MITTALISTIKYLKIKKILTKIRDIYLDEINPAPRRMKDGVNFNNEYEFLAFSLNGEQAVIKYKK